MLNIKIDKEEVSVSELVDYLNHVATLVKDGYNSGEGWDITGEDEANEEDDETGE